MAIWKTTHARPTPCYIRPQAALAVAVGLPYFHQYRFDTAFPTRAMVSSNTCSCVGQCGVFANLFHQKQTYAVILAALI